MMLALYLMLLPVYVSHYVETVLLVLNLLVQIT